MARSHGEGLDDFDWRVSIADVKAAGAFSFSKSTTYYWSIGREGLTLHVDKNPAVTLKQKSFAFNGESEVYAELIKVQFVILMSSIILKNIKPAYNG